MEHPRRPERRVRTERHRIQKIVVHPPVEDVDALEPGDGTGEEHTVSDRQILPLDQLDAHLAGEQRVLVVRGVVDARGQYRHPRGLDGGRERGQDRVQALAVLGDLPYPMLPVELGERALHRITAAEHVGDPRGDPEVVLQHRESVAGAHDVRAAHRDVDGRGEP